MVKHVLKIDSQTEPGAVEKGMAFTADQALYGAETFTKDHMNRRGINVYSFSELMGISARNKWGDLTQGTYEQPLFSLTPDERVAIFRHCAYIFGVISSRMKRISSFDYDIVPDIKNDDMIAEELRTYNALYREYSKRSETKYKIAAQAFYANCLFYLPDLLPDMSNFSMALLRWYRKLKSVKADRGQEIYDWLQQPNINDTWSAFMKKWVFDLYIHGSVAVYKETLGGLVENLYILPGGTVMPLKSRYIGGGSAFVQIVPGLTPQVFFTDEMLFAQYLPNSSRAHGMVPLDALINKIAETLMFDKLMAEQADGTKPPEKVVVFGDNSPFGDLASIDMRMPLAPDEQKKIETVINEVRKNAIRTLSGVGQPMVLDLTRENTMGIQMQRQDQVKKDIALVYNMTNMEINESGGDETSGRSTADAQATIEKEKGIYPDIRDIEMKITKEVLPFRFGAGYRLKMRSGYDNSGDLAKWAAMAQSGLYSQNEIRTEEMGKEPFDGPQYDVPDSPAQAANAQPGGPGAMPGM